MEIEEKKYQRDKAHTNKKIEIIANAIQLKENGKRLLVSQLNTLVNAAYTGKFNSISMYFAGSVVGGECKKAHPLHKIQNNTLYMRCKETKTNE